MPSAPAKVITARLSPSLQQAVSKLARKRGVSTNALLVEALEREIREQEEKEFFDSFTLLGEDAQASSVEFAIHAQAEVVEVVYAEPTAR